MLSGTHFTLEVQGQAPETFAVVDFRLSQSYSTLFSLTVTAASRNPAVSLNDLLESDTTLTILRNGIPERRVQGILTACEQGDTGRHQTLYTLHIRPPFWRSTLRRNCRIFQHTGVQGIAAQLLDEMLVTRWQPRLFSPLPEREFCVQFMESDYDFLSRLLAEEGIFTFEAESGGDQLLTLCDDAAGLAEGEALDYHPDPGSETQLYHIMQFRRSAQIRPAQVTTQDYTFKSPGWQGRFNHTGERLDAQYPVYEIFDYPGRFKDEGHGQAFTRYQTEGWRNNAETVSGVSNSPKLWPGVRFALRGHPRADLNTQWQVVSSELSGEQPQALVGSGGQGTVLTNRFQVIPGSQTWRPTPLPKPAMDGPQTAVVTGPPGEEIFCDEHGRVRVKFTWDRYNPADETSSCWIRVSQAWAGTGFGNLAIPRVGQEVIVDFLNGDPDQPVVVGRTYHADNRSPGSLPGTKTQMSIRSKTYKGGGFNELMFEDATGQELLSMHAQKDMKTVVLNDQSTAIVRDQSLVVGRNRLKIIGGNEEVKIEGHQTVNISQFQNINVKTDVTQFNGGSRIQQSAGEVVMGSGTMIRLECGNSALELHASGVINLKGTSFNIVTEKDSIISTGKGVLGLNPGGAIPGIGITGDSHKADLTAIIDSLFPPEQGGE